MLTLYDYLPSQNAWKVRQLLAHLQRPYRTQLVSIFEGEGSRDAFRAISPTGTVPAHRARRRTRAGRIERDPDVPRRRHAVSARRRVRAREGLAMAVLRAGTGGKPDRRAAALDADGEAAASAGSAGRAQAQRRAQRAGDPRSANWPRATSSPASATASPTSRCSPTPAAPMKPASTCGPIRTCARGLPGCRRSRDSGRRCIRTRSIRIREGSSAGRFRPSRPLNRRYRRRPWPPAPRSRPSVTATVRPEKASESESSARAAPSHATRSSVG